MGAQRADRLVPRGVPGIRPPPSSEADADRFVEEQTRIGALLDADPLPTTAADLARWIEEHPAIESTRAQANAIVFLRDPPLPLPVRAGYRLLFNAAVSTLPPRIAEVIGLSPVPGAHRVGSISVSSLRWALGSSPSWHVALGAQRRSGAERPVPPAAAGLTPRRTEPGHRPDQSSTRSWAAMILVTIAAGSTSA